MNYDVLVIGGGPAGTAAALSAACTGAKVALCEQRKSMYPTRCAGLILTQYWPAAEYLAKTPLNLIKATINTMHIITNDGELSVPTKGIIVDRAKFDTYQIQQCVEAGVTVFQPKRVTKFLHEQNMVTGIICSDNTEIQAAHIIAACGPKSRLLASIQPAVAQGSYYAIALQTELNQPWLPNSITTVFDHCMPNGFYGWVFPGQNDGVSIGTAVNYTNKEKALPALLSFLDYCRIKWSIDAPTGPITGGLVPLRQPRFPKLKNLTVIGDAAGHLISDWFAGINLSVAYGLIAGKAVSQGTKPFAQLDKLVHESINRRFQLMQTNYNISDLATIIIAPWTAEQKESENEALFRT